MKTTMSRIKIALDGIKSKLHTANKRFVNSNI